MAATKEELNTLFERIDNFNLQKSSLTLDIKEAFETFATQKEEDKKLLRKAYREYVEIQKDRNKYLSESTVVDGLVNKILE